MEAHVCFRADFSPRRTNRRPCYETGTRAGFIPNGTQVPIKLIVPSHGPWTWYGTCDPQGRPLIAVAQFLLSAARPQPNHRSEVNAFVARSAPRRAAKARLPGYSNTARQKRTAASLTVGLITRNRSARLVESVASSRSNQRLSGMQARPFRMLRLYEREQVLYVVLTAGHSRVRVRPNH